MAFQPHRIEKLRVLNNNVLVEEMNFQGRQLSSGIILPNDNGKAAGIRPRWGRVYAVGPEQKDVTVGQWICVAHGRWTRGIDIEDSAGAKTIRRIDPNDILLVSNQHPGFDDTISSAISGT
jgi:co-chaperonin GroES (HSP10)